MNLDFKGEAFKFGESGKHMGDIMPYAYIYRLRAICTYSENGQKCGRNADFSQRLINGKPAHYEDPLILVGEKECLQD